MPAKRAPAEVTPNGFAGAATRPGNASPSNALRHPIFPVDSPKTKVKAQPTGKITAMPGQIVAVRGNGVPTWLTMAPRDYRLNRSLGGAILVTRLCASFLLGKGVSVISRASRL